MGEGGVRRDRWRGRAQGGVGPLELVRYLAEWLGEVHRHILHLGILLVDFLLQYLEVGPEDVPHEGRGPGEELLLGDGTDLPAAHREPGHEGVDVGALQAELPDGPGQPGRHVGLAPQAGVPGDPQAGTVHVPRTVRRLQHVAEVLSGPWREGWRAAVDDAVASAGLDAAVCFGEVTEARHFLDTAEGMEVLGLVLDVQETEVDSSLGHVWRTVEVANRLHPGISEVILRCVCVLLAKYLDVLYSVIKPCHSDGVDVI